MTLDAHNALFRGTGGCELRADVTAVRSARGDVWLTPIPASRQRALETEAPVRAIKVVVIDVLGEQSMEVSLVDDDRVVQTLRAD
jgi:hypothetical protein